MIDTNQKTAEPDLRVTGSTPSFDRSLTNTAVDHENPWPGLSTFTEEQTAFFFGRDEEVRELLRRVERKALTILFGQSGLGKSSLLQAGVFPRLRVENFCPVYVRLDHAPDAVPLTEQIKSLVFDATANAGTWTKMGSATTGESLWEFFHHRDDCLQNDAGKVVTPVLVFDQFEELFTLGGAADPETRRRATDFIAELADLVENRPPASVEARLEEAAAEIEAFDFSRADYRVLITLREDYLPHLESLKSAMPSLMQNRMRLTRMQAPRALEAVMKPAEGLVTEEVAEQIVSFVAGHAQLEGAEVEPSLLSLVCRELNNQRRTRGEPVISTGLLAGTRDTILREFYERTMADQPAAVWHFVEDELLTDSGYRENIALERARKHLADAGANPAALDVLVNRRLLRIEERLDVRRVELTHDVLCSVVKASRNLRHERETLEKAERQLQEQQAREAATRQQLSRARKVATVSAILMLVAAGSAVFGFFNLRRARVAEAQAEATRRLAEQARGEAEKLVGFLIEDFYTELEPTGRLETMSKLAHRAVAYYDGLPPALLTSGTQAYRGMALVREGAALQARGNVAAAAKQLDEAQAVFEKLRAGGDQSEDTAVGLALALQAKGSGVARNLAALQQAADLLKPRVQAAGSSRRVRLLYAEVLNTLAERMEKQEAAIATCEEARRILVEMGGKDLTDLSAASAYGDTTDTEARTALALGRLDDAERLEHEELGITEKVLAQRPGDLKAMLTQAYTPQLLATIAAQRLDFAGALVFAAKSEQAASDYVRFNPTDAQGWDLWSKVRYEMMDYLLAQGKAGEALAQGRFAAALEHDPRNSVGIFNSMYFAWLRIAVVEAQLGHRPAADEAIQEGRRIAAQWPKQAQLGETLAKLLPELQLATEDQVRLAFGEYAPAFAEAKASLDRIKTIVADEETSANARARSYRDNLENAFLAAVHLGQTEDAEAAARAYLDDPLKGIASDRISYLTAWRRVLLAQALVAEGRLVEVPPILDPALAFFRDQQGKSITSVGFLQRVARAISGSGAQAAQAAKATASVEFSYRAAYAMYVQALAQADDGAGRNARRDALDEAAKSLQGIPEEAKQFHDWKELNELIFKARTRSGK